MRARCIRPAVPAERRRSTACRKSEPLSSGTDTHESHQCARLQVECAEDLGSFGWCHDELLRQRRSAHSRSIVIVYLFPTSPHRDDTRGAGVASTEVCTARVVSAAMGRSAPVP